MAQYRRYTKAEKRREKWSVAAKNEEAEAANSEKPRHA